MFAFIRRLLRGPVAPPYQLDGVSVEEARIIESALRGLPEFDHRILSMIRESPHSIIVQTGVVLGPLAGKGETLRVTQDEAGWHFELIGVWVA